MMTTGQGRYRQGNGPGLDHERLNLDSTLPWAGVHLLGLGVHRGGGLAYWQAPKGAGNFLKGG